jgi:2-(1,2-epoxy-1,2-dihydrophenyl)acetyl-CoA isomerase
MTFQPVSQTNPRVTLKSEGGIASITLNRARNANAIDVPLARDLKEALQSCERDKDLRAILLCGDGRLFCAGGDLAAIHGSGPQAPAYVAEILTHLHEAISIIARIPVPVIAGVNGAAAGAGLALACSCDLVVAAQSARFIMAYARVGLTPDGSSSWYLPRLIGMRRALELALMGRELSAEEALAWGLINEVVADQNLQQRLAEIGTFLSAGPTSAFGDAKRLLRESLENSLDAQMNDEMQTLCRALTREDAAIGMAAFLKRVPPVFKK